jgi:hypothetical protein
MAELTELRTCKAKPAISVRDEDMDAIRRQFLGGFITLGAAEPLARMLGGLENLRNLVDDRLGTSQLGEWEERVWEHTLTVNERVSIEDLAQDLLAVQRLAQTAPTHEDLDWERVNARMTFLLAYALGSAGQARESRKWYASARRSAQRADDPELLSSIASFEAVQGLYEDRPLPIVMARISDSLAAAQDKPYRGAAAAYGAKGHVLALLGDQAGALAALADQARVHERLSGNVLTDTASLYGWPVERLLHSRSLVYTLIGHPQAGSVQQEALDAYPTTETRQAARVRQAAQVELHRAVTTVQTGDILDGIDHARAVLAALDPADRNRYVRHIAGTVLQQVPPVEQTREPVIEYRAHLELPPSEGA